MERGASCPGRGPPPYQSDEACANKMEHEILPKNYAGYSSERHSAEFSPQEQRPWIQAHCGTVAGGPVRTPGGSWKYKMNWSSYYFLSSYPGLLGAFPSQISPTKSHSSSATTSRLCRCVACRLKGAWDRTGIKVNHKWSLNPSPSISNAWVRPDEVEQLVHSSQDWTGNWGWAITLRVCNISNSMPGDSWDMDVRILVKDLLHLLQGQGIRWDESQRNRQLERILPIRMARNEREINYRRWHAFSSTGNANALDACDWVAEVCITNQDEQWHKRHYFRDLLSVQYVSWAEIDQRTAPGRCKKMVAYRREITYGNDLSVQKLEAWHPNLLSRFSDFIKPLLPNGSEKVG
ncbi:hypothetical protein FDECE_5900 [Fusarium decemcellulare]|nr:hypothetical protein FDECE_5900 [Fusarium decemcellulare]